MSFLKRLSGTLEESLYKTGLISEIDGIKIANFRKKNERFEKVAISALNLIKQVDPRRYKRVKNEVSWILNSNIAHPNGAEYNQRTKGCVVNCDMECDDEDYLAAWLATTIVHEATHGYLFSMGIPYRRETRIRVERICTLEENRFAEKIEKTFPHLGGKLVREFNPKDWEPTWSMSAWKRAYYGLKRVIED